MFKKYIVHISNDEIQIITMNKEINHNQHKTQYPKEVSKQYFPRYLEISILLANRYAANTPGSFVMYVDHLSFNVGRLYQYNSEKNC